jgi:hypothetical protein
LKKPGSKVFGLITPATPRGSEWNPAVNLNGWEECNVPSLRNLERRLLGVERRLARPVEIKIPLTLVRAALDQMNHADRQRLSELRGLLVSRSAAVSLMNTKFGLLHAEPSLL